MAVAPSISALPGVVEAVQGRCEVLFDGGARSGQDILRSMALGARAAITGRAFLYGLGALGREGVTTALQIMSRELQVTLALIGATTYVMSAGRLRMEQ